MATQSTKASGLWSHLPIKYKIALVGIPAVTAAWLYKQTDKVPYSGRKRLVLLSSEVEKKMGKQAFQEIISSQRILSSNHPRSLMVRKVGERIAKVSGRDDFDWEFVVIDSPEINAFVLPGGKVCVYSGMFQLLKNEDSLAAVLGHEAAHAIARHVAEKLTISGLFFTFLLLFSPNAMDMAQILFKFGIDLPFSRKYETEADAIGLRLMAKACFDPRESPKMFHRMETAKFGINIPKYLSTHPPGHERISKLNNDLSEALNIYTSHGCGKLQSQFESSMHHFSTIDASFKL